MKDETRAVMFSSKTDLWETPAEIFDELDQEFHFTVDVCALPENAKCRNYYTPEVDGLSQKWGGIAWCNPPYGRTVGEWVKKAHDEQENGNTVVMLLPARTDTKWFHEHIYKQDGVEIRFIKGRLKFGGAKNPAPFPSMIVIFRKKEKTMARYFVIRQETGVRIDEVESYRDARELIAELEEEDKERSVYNPNSYSIEIV